MIIEQTPRIFRAFFPGVIWRIPQKEKTIYLTFDDGPVPEATPFVLDLLAEHNIKATFFCVGDNVFRHPELYARILEEGHSVGNHTHNHLQGFKSPTKEYLENVEKAACLIDSRLFRPPHGQLCRSQMRELKKNYNIILWDVITRDYNCSLTGEFVFNVVKKYARNGSIIVFHDSLKAEKNMKYALPKAIDFLMQEGYKFEVLNPALLSQKTKLPIFKIKEILSCEMV